jgi:hypothetical protein
MLFFEHSKFLALLCCLLGFSQFGQAQTPNWMFALEGTYIGRQEIPDIHAGGGRRTNDARLDGRKNGEENGFVLQWREEGQNEEIEVRLETWHWDAELEQVVITRIVENKPIAENWFVLESDGAHAVLSRGGEHENGPALLKLTFERLPGQLRLDLRANNGSGKWTEVYRMLLDDAPAEE